MSCYNAPIPPFNDLSILTFSLVSRLLPGLQMRPKSSLLFLIFIQVFFQIPSGLLIGLGKYDITGPVVNVNFMGYGEPSQTGHGLHLRLYSRAFLIKSASATRPILFINLDAGMPSQLLKSHVVRLLQASFGASVFDHQNVMISATHTHSGPGGFFQYLLFDATSYGFSKPTFKAMAAGILQSVKLANQSMTPGRILYASGDLSNASINRSPFSYQQNPAKERKPYSHDVDQRMLLLKFVAKDGRELGILNWFAVHCTSMNKTNRLVSSDNKGLAELLFERWMNDANTGNGMKGGNFVAAFAQANEGDVSPNTQGARCVDSGAPCDPLTNACGDGRVQNCIAFGPGANGDMFESTRLIAQRQFKMAKRLYAEAKQELIGENDVIVDFRHQFVDMTNVSVTYGPEEGGTPTRRTCKPALGYSFAAGTADGPGISDFTQGMLNKTAFWGFLSFFLARPPREMVECHAPKPILIPTGLMNYPLPWHPSIVETQVFQIGELIIVGLPGEFTTMAGRRMVRALSQVLPRGSIIALAGLSNLYTHYVTTFEEYQIQRYEGASTIFGPHTLQAYVEQFVKLTEAMINKKLLPPGPQPPFPLSRLPSFSLPPFYDVHPPFRKFGSIWKPPKAIYSKSDGIVEVSFVTGDPRNDLRTNSTFLTVEKQLKPHQWEVVYTDADWETKFIWKRVSLWFHVAEIQWTINSPFRGCQPGTYRIRHFGTAKTIFSGMHDFHGETEAFKVFC